MSALQRASQAAAIAVSVLMCATPTSTGGPGQTLATLVLTPDVASLQQDGFLDLSATGLTAAGDTVSIAVAWTATGGTLANTSTRGGAHLLHYQGTSCGTQKVVATSQPGALSDTAVITVTCAAAVAAVVVAPGTGTVAIGATLALTATPQDANGTPLTGRIVTWQSDDPSRATVDAQGLVRGVAAGVVTITAAAEGRNGTAVVTVTTPTTTLPSFGHIVLVLEENTNYASVIGTSSMPYLNALASQYGLATQYYANTHPSIGNYFMLTVGNIVTNDDAFTGTVTDDNLIRHLVAAGKTWKSYAEGLPSVGYTGDGPAPYVRRHNPMAYLSDVVNDPAQRNHLVPFSQFATDLAADQLPEFSFIAPNLCNDAHDCSLGTADQWLQGHLDPLLRLPSFQQDGLLLIVFDESANDNTHGGGRIVWVAVGPRVRAGHRSTALYQHQSTLRLILQGLGLSSFPNAAATAPEMGEFFLP